MIHSAAVFTKGGSLLWTKPVDQFDTEPINRLICEMIIPQLSPSESTLKHNLYNVKWLPENDLGLIFTVVYLHFSDMFNVEDLLVRFRDTFCEKFGGNIKGITLVVKPEYDFSEAFEEIEKSFQRKLSTSKKNNKIKSKRNGLSKLRNFNFQSDSQNNENSDKTKPNNLLNQFVNGGNKSVKFPKGKKEERKTENKEEMKKSSKRKKKKVKEKRTWNDKKLTKSEKIALDFSKKSDQNIKPEIRNYSSQPSENINLRSSSEDENLFNNNVKNKEIGFSQKISTLFNRISSKRLTETDLEQAMEQMEKLLIDKNVASEISRSVCKAVLSRLAGKTTSKFSSTDALVRRELSESLTKIITPTRTVNLLRGIEKTREKGRPFTITFVGVNGVGKSTTLSKIAHYLCKRNLKVSIAACDTFRSGAVEQLLTHAGALNLRVFQKGYAKDAAKVCQLAMREAQQLNDDVVLIDTAGRMQNNEPLMRSLSKLVEINKPDIVLFVCEALAGNESLSQLENFMKFVKIDGIILTKFDAVDDKVGTAISLTYKSRLPIVFVGTGQTYDSLSTLKPELLAKMLCD